jgi:hypothetical protein
MPREFPNPIYKDPQEVLDYEMGWATWLGTDTIEDTTWTVPEGLTKLTESFTDTTSKVWLSGGTVGDQYDCTCEIVTVEERVAQRTLTIIVEQR